MTQEQRLGVPGEYGVPEAPALAEVPKPTIEIEESDGRYTRLVAEPLEAGFGITVGNALRRVLLSRLPGAAVTWVRIDQAQHEFSTIPHVKEDTMEFLLNVKEIRLRALSDRPGKMYLDAQGEREVAAGDIEVPPDYEMVNPELHLATLDSPRARLTVEFNVERGRGYVSAGSANGLPIGVIPIDAIFTPVVKVNYHVERTRVGQVTNYDRLVLEVWTDGSISSEEAVCKSADILLEQFALFSHLGRPEPSAVGLAAGVALPPEQYNTPLEELGLSVRAYNSLKRHGFRVVGQLLEKREEELLAIRNFGKKSYDEVRQRLIERGYLSREEPPAYEEGEEGVGEEAALTGAEGLEAELPSAEELEAEAQAEAEGLAGRLSPEVLRKLRQLAAGDDRGGS